MCSPLTLNVSVAPENGIRSVAETGFLVVTGSFASNTPALSTPPTVPPWIELSTVNVPVPERSGLDCLAADSMVIATVASSVSVLSSLFTSSRSSAFPFVICALMPPVPLAKLPIDDRSAPIWLSSFPSPFRSML